MKRVVITASMILGSLVLGTSALASDQIVSLGDDVVGVSQIEGNVTGVRPLCPEGVTCFTNGTVIDLSFTLQGCADRLGPVSYAATQTEDGRLAVSVSALNIHDRQSMVMMCFVAPTATATITLINQYGDVDVTFLTSLASIQRNNNLGTETETEAAETASVTSDVVIECSEPVDHGATLTFHGNADGQISRAVYSETTIVETTVVADMGVCRQHATEGNVADAYELTASCNDTLWVDSYEVELFEGGFSGIPQAKIYKGPSDRQLVKQLSCRYL